MAITKSINKFFSGRIGRFLLLVCNVALLVYCVIVAAVILYQHPVRFDLTASKMNTLSDETKTCLDNLDEQVEIIVAYGEADPRNMRNTARMIRRIQDVLQQFKYASDKIKVIDVVDIYQNGETYLALKEKHNLTGPNRATFLSGSQKQEVRFEEMADYIRGGQGGSRRIGAFKVERSFTAAIRRLKGEPITAYFLKNKGVAGQAGPSLGDASARGLTLFVNELRSNNYRIKTLELEKTGKVPADCEILLSIGLTGPLFEEWAPIMRYLQGGGMLFIALNPRYNPKGLAFLNQWGVEVRPAWVVMEKSFAGNKIQTSRSMATQFNPQHEITSKFTKNMFYLELDYARPLASVKEAKFGTGEPLVWVEGSNIWGERAATPSDKPWTLGPQDFPSPLPVAMATEHEVEKGVYSRVVVFGSWSFLQNRDLEKFDHISLLHNSLWWLRGQDESISVRETEDIVRNVGFQPDGSLRRAFGWIFLAVVPGLSILAGLAAYVIRRR